MVGGQQTKLLVVVKIREIHLVNFKRFTDTTISEIPAAARLVLLVGPNGCGKSSLIDAVYTWHRFHDVLSGNWDDTYHRKQIPGAAVDWNQAVTVTFHDPQPATDEQKRKAVYARSAYRNDPEFQLDNLSRVEPAVREFRIGRLIDNDQAVSLNYRRLVSQGFQEVYESAPEQSSVVRDLSFRQRRKQSLPLQEPFRRGKGRVRPTPRHSYQATRIRRHRVLYRRTGSAHVPRTSICSTR